MYRMGYNITPVDFHLKSKRGQDQPNLMYSTV
jgi:hypothetical protein